MSLPLINLLDFVAPCPYCYADIDLRCPDFRCLGRPSSTGKTCTKQLDEKRRDHFGDTTDYYPAFPAWATVRNAGKGVKEPENAKCTKCQGVTSVRLCPNCHSRLPEGFSGESPLFGLVGMPSSGKTVMLAVMLRELSTNGAIAKRFGHVITTYGASEKYSQANILKETIELMEDGYLPEKTEQAAGKVDPVVIEWKIPREGLKKAVWGDRSVVLSFFDSAGEDFAGDERALNMHYLLATNGLIVILDPFSFPNNVRRLAEISTGRDQFGFAPETMLHAITEALRQNEQTKRNRKIKQPIAVVISKIDAFFDDIPETDPIRVSSSNNPYYDDAEAKQVHDHIASLVQHWGGQGLLKMLDANFANYRLFGASALGSPPDYASATIDPRGLLPHRVTEPLLWLMAESGFIQRRG